MIEYLLPAAGVMLLAVFFVFTLVAWATFCNLISGERLWGAVLAISPLLIGLWLLIAWDMAQ